MAQSERADAPLLPYTGKEYLDSLDDGREVWLERLGAARELLRAASSDPESNKKLLHQLASQPAFEQFQQLAKVLDTACEPVQLGHDHGPDLPFVNQLQHALNTRPVGLCGLQSR